MKHAILSLLVMTSTVTTVAVAQEGNGGSPPHSPIVIGPSTPVPTTSPTQPPRTPSKLISASATK